MMCTNRRRAHLDRRAAMGAMAGGIAAGLAGCLDWVAAVGTQDETPIRTVAVESDQDGAFYHPLPEHIEAGRYSPLTRPLYIYVNHERLQENPDVLGSFLQFYVDGQQDFARESGYFATSDEVVEENEDTIAALFDEPALRVVLIVLTVTIPLLAIYNVMLSSFNAIKQLRFRVYTRDVIRPTVRLAVTTGLLLVGYGILGIVGGYVLGLIAAIALGFFLLRRRVDELSAVKAERVRAGPLLWYSVPLALAGVIYVVLGQVDYFIIGIFMTSEEVGIYRVGYMLAANLLIVFASVSPVFKPLIAEVKHDDVAVERRFQTAIRWIVGLSLPLAMVLALGAEVYLSLVFTPQYGVASAAVIILCAGYLVSVAAGGPDGTFLQGIGHSRLVFVNTLLLVMTNVVVSALLVPQIGITGAAIGTASALSVAGIAALVEVYYLRGIHPFSREFLKLPLSAFPALIAGGVIVLMEPGTLLVALLLPVIVLVTYVAALVLLDAFTEEDAVVAGHFGPGVKQAISVVRR